jgi:hypothetical protein
MLGFSAQIREATKHFEFRCQLYHHHHHHQSSDIHSILLIFFPVKQTES